MNGEPATPRGQGLDHEAIARVFRSCFLDTHQTELVGGASEPIYLPRDKELPAQLKYRENFAASALHEAAHWCIAGPLRRAQVDFGYAYSPPPRSAEDQARFFRFELRAQSLESLFAEAASVSFHPSADNLQADAAPFARCLAAHRDEMKTWMQKGRDPRAKAFHRALWHAREALEADHER